MDPLKRPTDDFKKPSTCEDELCDVCRDVDFLSFFRSRDQKQEINTLEVAKQNTRCPFCRVLVSLITEYSTVKNPGKRPTRCFIRSNTVLGFTHSTETHKACLEIYTLLNHRTIGPISQKKLGKPALQLLTGSSGPEQSWARFDAVITPRGYREKVGKKQFVMTRRIVKEQCDFNLLRSWIDLCESTHAHLQREEAKEARPQLPHQTQGLIDDNLLRMIDVRTHKLVALKEDRPFVALSYVWGTSMKRTSETDYTATESHEPSKSPQAPGGTRSWRLLHQGLGPVAAYCQRRC